ncbi:hypothetical protein VTJ04DRAFT_737 [Mycothermus thermophilus]|uniref:uncharacterized protein n=1 Tax=Humicola insolens TaxID=85995 RepID=UPI00374375BD
MEAREVVADDMATATLAASYAQVTRSCPGINLPVGGVLSMPNGEIVTLTAAAAFKPLCTPVSPPAIIANGGGGSVTIDDDIPEGSMPTENGWTYSDFRDPFYASTFPQCYALAATTVVAYMLVIMLFVTPRSFLDGGVVVLGRRGFTNGGTGPTIGGRPWLQKVAALAVAISLTIASAATFSAAEQQYSFGVQNAKVLQMEVLGGTELKIIRIISNTFLWLAQAQTLIRLFPRHREKVIIKWAAFALITLDVIFQSLNSFQYDQGIARPGSFQDAVPALSYLFALSLGVLYAAWVIYYALLKKRYAFYHPQMKNMVLMAVLSILSVVIPVVFFILDICKPEFTGWGEYVRWVGAAAASVVVWEWVERIEALEREEKRDGILGREVFDGDEMLDMTRPNHHGLRRRRKGDGGHGDHNDTERKDAGFGVGRASRWPAIAALSAKYKHRARQKKPSGPTDPTTTESSNHDRTDDVIQPPLWPARPRPAVTPISRADTASAASTIYAVRYHPPTTTESNPRTPPPPGQQNHNTHQRSRSNSIASSRASDDDTDDDDHRSTTSDAPPTSNRASRPLDSTSPSSPHNRWRAITQHLPFRRDRDRDRSASDPEQAVSPTTAEAERKPTHAHAHHKHKHHQHKPSTALPASSRDDSDGPGTSASRWDLRSRLEDFAATQAERLRERFRSTPDTDSLPVTVIPAPPRPGAALAKLLEEEAEQVAREQRAGNNNMLATASTSAATATVTPQVVRWQGQMQSPTQTQTPSPRVSGSGGGSGRPVA